MELRGADFDWGNWAGVPADLLAAAQASAAHDGMRPSLAARALAVLRRRTNPAPGAEAGAPGGDGGAGDGRGAPPEKAGAGLGPAPANGANGADHEGARNGSRGKGHVAAASPPPAHSGGDAGDSDEEAGEGTGSGGERRRRSGGARQGAEGLRQGLEQQPGLRRGAGSGTLEGGDRARGSQRSLGSGTLDGGERERGSRRSLGIGSRRSLDSARRHEVQCPNYLGNPCTAPLRLQGVTSSR